MIKRFIDKFTSGRFLTAMMIIGTYCTTIILCGLMVLYEKIAVDTLLALFAGFSALAGMVVEGYFHKKNDNEAEKK